MTKGLCVLKARDLLEKIVLPKKNQAALCKILASVSADVVTYYWHQSSMTNVMNVVEADTTHNSEELCICGGKGK